MSNPRNAVHLIGRIPNTEKIGYNYKVAQDPKHNSMMACISVRRAFKKKDEQYYPEDLFNIKAFGATADYMNKFVKRGDMIALDGELQRDEDWTDSQGQSHRGGYSIRIDSITKVGGEKSEGVAGAATATPGTAAPINPFSAASPAPAAAATGTDPIPTFNPFNARPAF